jgi:hypothetical protein
MIPCDGDSVRAAKIDNVRDQFKSLLWESQLGDLTDAALKKRWQRAKDTAFRDGVVKATTHEGEDYLWEIVLPM